MNISDYQDKEFCIHSIRSFFKERNFTEIFVPILNDSIPLEPTIYPFETTWNTIDGSKKHYLPTSPERTLKIALSEGVGNCFSIAPSFRNLEDKDFLHFPEFLMLEWYRVGANWKDIMKDVEELVRNSKFESASWWRNSKFHARSKFKVQHIPTNYKLQTTNYQRISMQELWHMYCNTDLSLLIDDHPMVRFAQRQGYTTEGYTWEQIFNQIFLNEIEPNIGSDPTFITHYPSRISPLCKPHNDDPRFAERFELYINGIEIGNGNTEETNTKKIRSVFENERKIRLQHNQIAPPIDETFLGALKKLHGTSYAGVGVGVERLMNILDRSRTCAMSLRGT